MKLIKRLIEKFREWNHRDVRHVDLEPEVEAAISKLRQRGLSEKEIVVRLMDGCHKVAYPISNYTPAYLASEAEKDRWVPVSST